MTNNNTDFLYALFESGRLNLMYLPSGAVAWLWSRPSSQVDAAENLAVASRNAENPIVDACLLRADQNVLILKCAAGQKFRIYPDGGYSFDGYPMGLDGCKSALANVPEHETCPCGCGGTCGCSEEPEDDAVVVDVPAEFTNYADEGIGGESTLSPRHGMGTGTPYSDVAVDTVAQMDLLDPESDLEHMGKRGYTEDEMEELAQAMGTYEYALESDGQLKLEDLVGEQGPSPLVQLAQKVKNVYDAAVNRLGPDLGGKTPRELLSDYFSHLPLRTIEDAMVVAGIPPEKINEQGKTVQKLESINAPVVLDEDRLSFEDLVQKIQKRKTSNG